MTSIAELWNDFTSSFMSAIHTIKPSDFIDWIVVAFLIYHGVRLVRETRAMQLVKGIAAILLVYFFAVRLQMNTLSFVLENIIGSGVLLLAVLFQPELRRALEQMGRSKIAGFSGILGIDAAAFRRGQIEDMIDVVCESCEYLSERKTGALIVVERETKIGEIVKTGTVIDSKASVELVTNIFFTNSPLHDGAMVVRGDRLYAAGCYLPLSSNMEIGRELGTRHRAALGMSEVSDAIVIVVSEETGAISVACESSLERRLTADILKKFLQKGIFGEQKENPERKPIFRKGKK